jgi:protein tyrosine/serine phosphatase
MIHPFHWAFDKVYPLIRLWHESVNGNAWFTPITPQLWLGGAPTYARDYRFLLEHGINAVVDLRAERAGDILFYTSHNIAYLRCPVLDIMAPDAAALTSSVGWTEEQLAEGRVVLVHCAKGRGRSATVLAAYLMKNQGLSYIEAESLMKARRPLTKLESRHEKVLQAWLGGVEKIDTG